MPDSCAVSTYGWSAFAGFAFGAVLGLLVLFVFLRSIASVLQMLVPDDAAE